MAKLGTVSYSGISGFSVIPDGKSPIKNGNFGMDPKLWKFIIDGAYLNGTNPPVSSGGAAGMIYSYDRGKDVQAVYDVNKDEFIKNFAVMFPKDKEDNAELYKKALKLGSGKHASQKDVDDTAAMLKEIADPFIPAESVTITPMMKRMR